MRIEQGQNEILGYRDFYSINLIAKVRKCDFYRHRTTKAFLLTLQNPIRYEHAFIIVKFIQGNV